MKTLLLGFTFIVAASISTSAHAKDLVSSFQGKIHNHTSIPTDKLIVQVIVDCSYEKGFVWPETVSCGYEVFKVPVNIDGTYTVPALKWLKRKSIKHYHVSFAVQAEQIYPESITYAGFSQKEIHSMQNELTEISIYEIPRQTINVVTPTGEDYAAWRGTLKHQPDYPCVELYYGLSVDEGYDFGGFHSKIFELARDKKVAGVIPRVFFGAAKNPGANIPIKVSLSYSSAKPECNSQLKSIDESTIEFNGTISEAFNYFNNSTYRVD